MAASRQKQRLRLFEGPVAAFSTERLSRLVGSSDHIIQSDGRPRRERGPVRGKVQSPDVGVAANAGRVFTGDVLLIGGTGRTDFAGGSPGESYDSIVNHLFTLPELTVNFADKPRPLR